MSTSMEIDEGASELDRARGAAFNYVRHLETLPDLDDLIANFEAAASGFKTWKDGGSVQGEPEYNARYQLDVAVFTTDAAVEQELVTSADTDGRLDTICDKYGIDKTYVFGYRNFPVDTAASKAA